MNENSEESNTSITSFRNQLHQVSDTFQKLSAEQQSEAVKLIQGLHSTLLNQLYLLANDPNEIVPDELCNQRHLLHNGELMCQFSSVGSSMDSCSTTSILSEKEDVNSNEILNSNSLLTHLSISTNVSVQREDNSLLKVPSEQSKLIGKLDENESPLDIRTFNTSERNSENFGDKNISSEDSYSTNIPKSNQQHTRTNDNFDGSLRNDCSKVSIDEIENCLEKSICKPNGQNDKKSNICTRNSTKKVNKDGNKSVTLNYYNRDLSRKQLDNKSLEQPVSNEQSEVMYPCEEAKIKRKESLSSNNATSNCGDDDLESQTVVKSLESKDEKSKCIENNNEPINVIAQSNKSVSSSKNAVSCIFCRKEFDSTEKMNEQFCCEDANKFKEIDVHYRCKICGANFSQQHHLQKHLQGHQRNNCQLCNAPFTRKKLLCKHMKLVHKISESEKFYYCPFCDRKFFKRPSLYTHLKVHANGKIVCTKCGAMNDSEEMHQKHMNKHAESAKYKCDFCSEKFVRRQQYEQHMTGHDRHVCVMCNTNFSTKKQFVKHCQMVHGVQMKQEKKHECNICKKRFLRPTLLRVHQRVHTGERPIPCAHCDKSFCTKKALTKHLQTESHLKHVGDKEGNGIKLEKPFLCAQCGANFYRSQGLLRHMQQIHGNSEVFECPHCDYKCKCKTNLKRHMELHTAQRRFVCELCGAAFHAFATLKDHNAYVHSETRSFVCEQCGKGFKGRSGLKRHMRIHSDARPYVCHCGQSYKRMSHLKRHMVSAHHVVFSSKRVKRINTQDSSDGETNTNAQDTTTEFSTAIDSLQDPTCDGFSVMLTSSDNNFMHNSDSCNNSILLDTATEMERVALAQVNNNSEDYILVSSVKLPSYLDKTNDMQAINGNESVILDIVKDNCSVSGSLVSLLQSQDHISSERSSQLHRVSPSAVHLQGLDQLAISSAHFQSLSTSSQASLSSEETIVTLGLTEPTLHLTSHLSPMSELNSSCSVSDQSPAGMQVIALHNNKSIPVEANDLSLPSVQSCQVPDSLSLTKLKNVQNVHLNMSYQQQLNITHTTSTGSIHSTESQAPVMVTVSKNPAQLVGSHSTLVAAKVTTAMTVSTTSVNASVSNNHSNKSMIKLPSTTASLHLPDSNHIFPSGHTTIHIPSGLQQPQELSSLAPQTYIGNECKFLSVIPQ